MRKKGMGLLSVVICALMLVPSLSSANSQSGFNAISYSSDGLTMHFYGQNVQILENNQSYTTSWVIDKVTAHSETQIGFCSSELKRIHSADQNSVVILLDNKDLRVAEIYSFDAGSIDASIALTNLLPLNTTYIITFVTISNHRSQIMMGGISSNTFDLQSSPRPRILEINSQSWALNDQFVDISWQSEMSLYHGGILVSSIDQNELSVPFGPLTLASNQSYTIDPNISPDKIIPPPGGGSGGGGSAPVPATIGSFSVSNYPSVFENNTRSLTFNYSINSFGSYSNAKIGFFAATDNVLTTTTTRIGSVNVSATGNEPEYMVNFSYIGQWKDIIAAVWYPYDHSWDYEKTTGNSFIVYEKTTYPFDYPNEVYNGPGGSDNFIYDPSTGLKIAGIYGSISGVYPIRPGGPMSDFTLSSGIAPVNSSFEVNQVGMYLNYVGNNIGQSPSYLNRSTATKPHMLEQYYSSYNYQGYGDQSDYKNLWTKIESVLWIAAFAAAAALSDGTSIAAAALFAVGGALDPFMFLPATPVQSPIRPPMNLSFYRNAGINSDSVAPSSWNAVGTNTYTSPDGYKIFYPSLIFQVGDVMIWNNPTEGTLTQYVVNYMEYTMSYSIFDSNNNCGIKQNPPLYSGSYSVFVFLPEEVAQTS